jgi:AP2 domain
MHGGKKRRLYLHRYLLDLDFGDKREGDHIDPKDTLNNMDHNLPIADRKGQCRNQTKRKHNTTGFKGVCKNKRGRRWRAIIGVDRTRLFLGNYLTPEEAARAYDVAALIHFGEFANLNFPKDS